MAGEKRKEMILVSHYVWMSNKTNYVRWGYESNLCFFLCILMGNLDIINNTQLIFCVSYYFSSNLTTFGEKQRWFSKGFVLFTISHPLLPFFIHFVIQKRKKLISLYFFIISHPIPNTQQTVKVQVQQSLTQ